MFPHFPNFERGCSHKTIPMADFATNKGLKKAVVQFIKGIDRIDGYYETLIPMVMAYFPTQEDWESTECRGWFEEIHLEQLSVDEMDIIHYFKAKRNARNVDGDVELTSKREEKKRIMDKIRRRHYALGERIYQAPSSKASGGRGGGKRKKMSEDEYIESFIYKVRSMYGLTVKVTIEFGDDDDDGDEHAKKRAQTEKENPAPDPAPAPAPAPDLDFDFDAYFDPAPDPAPADAMASSSSSSLSLSAPVDYLPIAPRGISDTFLLERRLASLTQSPIMVSGARKYPVSVPPPMPF